MKRSAAVLLALACAASAFAQDGRKLTAAPDRRVELDLQHYYGARDLQVALTALATAYPEFLHLESIGRSRGGRDLWVMTVGALEGADARERPALLLAGSLGRDDVFGAELALATIFELAQNHARDAAVEQLLQRAVVYVVPSVNPDLRERAFAELEGAPAAPGVRELGERASADLDHNFPVLWDPLKNARAGPYPLCEPEARALAEFLLGRPNIAVVMRYSTPSARSLPTTREWPASDRDLHRRIAAENLLEGLEALDGSDGGLLAFAYGQHGAFVFSQPVSFAPTGAWALPGVLEIQTLAHATAPAALRLANALPRLALTPGASEALGGERWSLDIELGNLGRLPTTSALGRERSACAAPRVDIAGAKLVGAALVAADGSAVKLETRGNGFEVADIAGGASVVLRLFLAAPAEAQLTVTASAPRAGRSSAVLVLR